MSEHQQCPTCGHDIHPDAAIRFDEECSIITSHGNFACLTETQMSVIIAIKDSWPRICTKEHLLRVLYLIRSDEPDMKILDVFICKLRPKIKGLGFSIDTIWGQGFRFVYDDVGDRGREVMICPQT